MAQHEALIEVLNEAVSLEYTAAVQYNQHSMLLTGSDKLLFEEIFRHHAKESLGHAKMWGDRIVYLGGVPKAEVGTIRQSTNIGEMLEMDLDVEKKAVEIYSRAHKICTHAPTRYMLENHILDEDKDVEELQKLLGKVGIAQAGVRAEKKVASARRDSHKVRIRVKHRLELEVLGPVRDDDSQISDDFGVGKQLPGINPAPRGTAR